MKKSLFLLIVVGCLLPALCFAQGNPVIKIDGNPVSVNPITGLQLPAWLKTGQTLAADQDAYSISVIEFTINGAGLEYSQTLVVTSIQTVPAGKTWKIESVFYEHANGAGTNWSLIGNAGTTAGVNFLGTTDAQALILKTDNLERVRITSGGNVGIGTVSPAVKLEIAGQIKITGGSPGLNKVLTSDAGGLASWTSLGSLNTVAGAGTLNFVPKWTPDGSTLGNSIIFDNGTNVGIGTTTPGSKLAVAGTIESTSGGVKFPDGSVQQFSGKVINVTYRVNSTRTGLAGSPSITLESFTVNKKSPTSFLLIDGTISGKNDHAGSMNQGWKYGSGTEVIAQSLMYAVGTHGKVYPTRAIIAGHATTGPQTLVFRYFTQDGSNGNMPFTVYNPNQSDDARIGQTSSVYVVWEIEP